MRSANTTSVLCSTPKSFIEILSWSNLRNLRFGQVEKDDSRRRIGFDLADPAVTNLVLGVQVEEAEHQSGPLQQVSALILVTFGS